MTLARDDSGEADQHARLVERGASGARQGVLSITRSGVVSCRVAAAFAPCVLATVVDRAAREPGRRPSASAATQRERHAASEGRVGDQPDERRTGEEADVPQRRGPAPIATPAGICRGGAAGGAHRQWIHRREGRARCRANATIARGGAGGRRGPRRSRRSRSAFRPAPCALDPNAAASRSPARRATPIVIEEKTARPGGGGARPPRRCTRREIHRAPVIQSALGEQDAERGSRPTGRSARGGSVSFGAVSAVGRVGVGQEHPGPAIARISRSPRRRRAGARSSGTPACARTPAVGGAGEGPEREPRVQRGERSGAGSDARPSAPGCVIATSSRPLAAPRMNSEER